MAIYLCCHRKSVQNNHLLVSFPLLQTRRSEFLKELDKD